MKQEYTVPHSLKYLFMYVNISVSERRGNRIKLPGILVRKERDITVYTSQCEWRKCCIYKSAECLIPQQKISVKKIDFFPPASDSLQKFQSVYMTGRTSRNFRGNVRQSNLRIHEVRSRDNLLSLQNIIGMLNSLQ